MHRFMSSDCPHNYLEPFRFPFSIYFTPSLHRRSLPSSPLALPISSNPTPLVSQISIPAFLSLPPLFQPPLPPSYILAVGRGGALVESTPFVRRVMGSTPALAAIRLVLISESVIPKWGTP